MQKQIFRLRNKPILDILFPFSSVALVVFGFLTLFPKTPENNYASAIIDGEEFALEITSNDSMNLTVTPTKTGAISITKDIVTANTNSPAGYKLFVSTSTDTNDIYLNAKKSNNTIDKKISATSGTDEAPAPLEDNSWGYAIAGLNNFNASYDTINPSTSALFAAVPEKDAEQLIHNHTGRATDDETEIYFATKANTNISSGSYKTTILYTTLSEATDQHRTEINVSTEKALKVGYEGEVALMETSIMTSRNIDNLKIKVNGIETPIIEVVNEGPLEMYFAIPDGFDEGDYDVELIIGSLAESYTVPGAIVVEAEEMEMQRMTSSLCASLEIGDERQMTDSRDGKVYWFAKLKDGNCWMTQNLDLDLSTNVTLTSENTDLNTVDSWTPPVSTLTVNGTWNDSGYGSFDPGNTYYVPSTTPTTGNYCDSIPLSSCRVTMNGSEVKEGFTSVDKWQGHTHAGNYYSYYAVVAGSQGKVDVNSDAPDSICPKGWKMPTSKDYSNLFQYYTPASILEAPVYMTKNGIYDTHIIKNSNGDRVPSTGISWAYVDVKYQTATINTQSYSFIAVENDIDRVGSTFSFNNNAAGTSIAARCMSRDNQYSVIFKTVDDEIIEEKTFHTKLTLPNIKDSNESALLGWSTNKDSKTPEYQVGETISEDMTLYAIYREEATLSDLTTMQQMTPEICAASDIGEEQQLTDVRDNKTYWVAKLADNNCWMTQNLDFDLNQSASFTHAEMDTVFSSWSGYRNTIQGAANLNSTNWKNRTGSPFSFDPGDYYYDGSTASANCNYLTTNCAHFSKTPYDSNGAHGHVGNYYSWTAAIGDSYYGNEYTTLGMELNNSICPAGWTLPHGVNSASGNDFAALSSASSWPTNSDKTLIEGQTYFVRAGYINNGALTNAGTQGYIWGSTVYSSSNAAVLSFQSNSVQPATTNNRGYGFTVRCIAR